MPSVRCPMDLSSSYSKSTAQRGTQPPRSKYPRSRVPSEAGAVAAGCLEYRRYASGGFKTIAEQSQKRNHLSGYGRLSPNTFRTTIMICILKRWSCCVYPATRLYPLPRPFYLPPRLCRFERGGQFAKLFLVIWTSSRPVHQSKSEIVSAEESHLVFLRTHRGYLSFLTLASPKSSSASMTYGPRC